MGLSVNSDYSSLMAVVSSLVVRVTVAESLNRDSGKFSEGVS